MSSALKIALEEILRARRLRADGPPLRGMGRSLAPLATGQSSVDALLQGGIPRGQVSEVHGPSSSGRTGLVLSLVARSTGDGVLAAWVDPADRLDPASASAAGVELARLLWFRGEPRAPRGLANAVAAVGTLLGSGIFELVVLDLAGIPACEVRRLPDNTWLRLQRMIEGIPVALVLVADAHVAHGPEGASLALRPSGPSWSGASGPGRLLHGLRVEARVGRHTIRGASLELRAFS